MDRAGSAVYHGSAVEAVPGPPRRAPGVVSPLRGQPPHVGTGARPVRRRWRVLHTMPDLEVGGGQVIALNGIRDGDHERYDFEVLAVRPEPLAMAGEFAAAGADPILLDWTGSGRAAQIAELVRLLRSRGVDLVHMHGLYERPAVLPAAAIARVPVVCHIHSEWVHLGPRFPPTPSATQRARARVLGWTRDALEHRAVRWYVADSGTAADLLRPHVRAPIDTMTQCMPVAAIDQARATHDNAVWRSELGLGPGPVAINVSRAVEGKGQDRVIRAFAAVRGRVPGAQLVLVGDGPLRPSHQQLARELGVEADVRFLPTRRDVPDLLVGADVFVFASTTESFGLVVGEAMVAGLPVLCYQLPALRSFTAPFKTGIYPSQDDEVSYVEGFCRLMRDGEVRREMGRAGRELALERFPAGATARSFEAVYDAILAPPEQRTPSAG